METSTSDPFLNASKNDSMRVQPPIRKTGPLAWFLFNKALAFLAMEPKYPLNN